MHADSHSKVNSLRAYHEANKGVVNKGNAYSVPPQTLEETPGFNVREYDRPDVTEHIRSLADAYKRGDYVPPIVVRVEGGRLSVRDGHCRRRALLLAIDEGADITRIPVIEHRGDEVEQNLLILTSNQGLPISPLGRAEIYARLVRWGKSPQEIADKIGSSHTTVSNYLKLHELPIALKQSVQDGKLSATAALELYQQHGTAAVGMVSSALEQALSTGRERITTKHIQKSPRISRAVVSTMTTHLHRITEQLQSIVEAAPENATVRIELSIEEAKELLDLREKLAPPSVDPQAEQTRNQLSMELKAG